MEGRVTTVTDDAIEIIWCSAGSVNMDDEYCTLIRPKNWFTELTLPPKYDFVSFMGQSLPEEVEVIAMSRAGAGKEDSLERHRPSKEFGPFIPELPTFPASFDACRMAIKTNLFEALRALSSDAQQDRAKKCIDKLETVKGHDPPLGIPKHQSSVRGLPVWLSSLLDFCVEAAKAGTVKERAVGLKEYFVDEYATWSQKQKQEALKTARKAACTVRRLRLLEGRDQQRVRGLTQKTKIPL